MSAKDSKKRGENQQEEPSVNLNPFETDMTRANPEFSLDTLVKTCRDKMLEGDKRKIKVSERVENARKAISRIQGMIDQLMVKTQQESGQTWVSQVIRPISDELKSIYPNASVEITGPFGVVGDVVVTLSKKGVSHDRKMMGEDTRSIVFVLMDEQALGIRDLSKDTGTYPPSSLGAQAGLNHPVVEVPKDRTIQFIVDWLDK